MCGAGPIVSIEDDREYLRRIENGQRLRQEFPRRAVGRIVTAFEGRTTRTPGLTVWLGFASILIGVALIVIGLRRYQRTKEQIDSRTFRPAGEPA